MYDIRQFKPTLYVLVILGLTGFSMAAEAPGLWAVSMIAIGLNIFLVRTKRFAPLPRWLANSTTIISLLYVLLRIQTASGPPLMYIGIFLVLLQLIKLYEQRANRDYVQIIVLSLLLMVAASINTADLMFGILLIVYLVLSLYCCLIFHLKVEADKAKSAFEIPEDKISPATLQLDQRYFSRSMRRLTALVSIVAVSTAVLIFLFFPRGAGAGILGQLQFKQANALVGFSEQVSFDQINDIKQNNQPVAHISVLKNGRPLEGTEPLLLRGLTLDQYVVDRIRKDAKPSWTRAWAPVHEVELAPETLWPTPLNPVGPLYRLKVSLDPTGTRYLFALSGLRSVRANKQLLIKYSAEDESVQTDSVILPLEYEVQATNSPTRQNVLKSIKGNTFGRNTTSDAEVIRRVREYAMGVEGIRPLVEKRTALNPLDETNEEIARIIERHLKSEFYYTLNLTDSKSAFRNTDPVVAFLTKVKKGHCEYFASAMALMCQSLEIPARIVVGFRCDEYNVYSGKYIVREGQAHTWVEVLTPRGWITFDPTAGRDAAANRTTGFFQSIKHFLDYVEHKWAENVVAYDTRDRQSLISRLDQAMTNFMYRFGGVFRTLRRLPRKLSELTGNADFWDTSSFVITSILTVLAIGVIVAVGYFLIGRLRLRRRAARIGLEHLPPQEQLRLARQLAFYDRLTQALWRYDIVRPEHLTPREFAMSLAYLPSEVYDSVGRLTELLYRIRFGDANLSAGRQRRLEEVVDQIDRVMMRRQKHV